jgi:hypothetical protein
LASAAISSSAAAYERTAPRAEAVRGTVRPTSQEDQAPTTTIFSTELRCA